jgi:hypothetical protein
VVLPTSEPEPVIADTTAEAVDETVKAPENADKNVCCPDQCLLLPSNTHYPLFQCLQVDIPTSLSPASEPVAVVSPVIEQPGNEPVESSVAPITAEAVLPVDDSHTKSGEPAHVDVGESSFADAKSDSGTTAVSDPEPTDVMNATLEPVPSPKSSSDKERDHEVAEKKVNNKPSALPTTPTKGEVFPGISPPSSPSRFSSLRGSGRKKRTSFFAKLKEVFKSDKEKDHSGKEKAATKH